MTKLGEQVKETKPQKTISGRGKTGRQVGAKPSQEYKIAREEIERKKRKREKEIKQRIQKLESERKKAKERAEEINEKYHEIRKKLYEGYYRAKRRGANPSHESLQADILDIKETYKPKVKAYREKALAIGKLKKEMEKGEKVYNPSDVIDFAQKRYKSQLEYSKKDYTRKEINYRKERQLKEFREGLKEETGVSYETFKKSASPGAKADILARYRAAKKGISKEAAKKELISEGTINIKKSKTPTGTYISPEGYKMSIGKESALEKVKKKGGKYYGKEQVFSLKKQETEQLYGKEKLYGKITGKEFKPLRYKLNVKPKIREKKINEFKPKGKFGETVIITETQLFDPLTGKKLREATQKEKEIFKKRKKTLSFGLGTARTGKKGKREWLSSTTQKGRDYLRTDFGIKIKDIKENLGKTVIPKNIEKNIATGIGIAAEYSTKILPGVSKKQEKQVGQFYKGITKGVIPSTIGEVGSDVALFGLSAGIGYAGKGTVAGSRALGKIGATKTGIKGFEYLGTGTKVAGVAGGIGLSGYYAYGVGSRVIGTEDFEKKGRIIGKVGKEFTIMGYGFGKGSRAFERTRGFFSTRGKEEIPIERLTSEEVLYGTKNFPTAPKSQQFKLFQGTKEKFPELTEGKPGGFHATKDKFWKGIFSPKKGSSELPGIYASSELSPYFLGVEGGGYKIFPRLSDLRAKGSPSIAFLKPEQFRITEFRKIPGKPSKPLGFEFTSKAKPGTAEVPLMKKEIESVFRPEAFEEGLTYTGGKYYTTFKGQRIPIDVFEYKGKRAKEGFETFEKGKGFRTTEYSLSGLSKEPLINLGALSSFYTSKTKTPKTFYKNFYKTGLKSSKISYKKIKYQPFTYKYLKFPKKSPMKKSTITSSKGPLTTYPITSLITSSKKPPTRKPPILIPPTPKKPIRRKPTFGFKRKPTKVTRKPTFGFKRKPTKVTRKPSLWAVGQQITAPKRGKTEFTGLTLRPIITNKKKKKKKSGWWFM